VPGGGSLSRGPEPVVQAACRLSNDAKALGLLQNHFVWDALARSIVGEFSVACRLAAWTIYDARLGAAFISPDFPALGCGAMNSRLQSRPHRFARGLVHLSTQRRCPIVDSARGHKRYFATW
jgi:hypothetical protein